MKEILAAFNNDPDKIGNQPMFYVDKERIDRMQRTQTFDKITFLSLKGAVLRMYPQPLQPAQGLEQEIAEATTEALKSNVLNPEQKGG